MKMSNNDILNMRLMKEHGASVKDIAKAFEVTESKIYYELGRRVSLTDFVANTKEEQVGICGSCGGTAFTNKCSTCVRFNA